MTKALLYRFFTSLIDWMFRQRTIASMLIKSGLTLCISAIGINVAVNLLYADQGKIYVLNFTTSDGLPWWTVNICFWLGTIMLLSGLALAIYQTYLTFQQQNRRKIIIVELRGLQSMPDTVAKEIDLGGKVGQRELIPLDFRIETTGGTEVNPSVALNKLATLPHIIDMYSAGRDKSDISLAIGGLAPVPLLFLAGMLVDDESDVTVFDWDRNIKSWRIPEGVDDGKRFLPLDIPFLDEASSEVVLAVSVSYKVDKAAVERAFGHALPMAWLTAEETLIDRHWSIEKQIVLVSKFRDAVQILMARGVKRIHMVLAAPASLTIRLGMAYDKRLMPELIVYQYEMSSRNPYPWGISMPTHGHASASLFLAQALSSQASDEPNISALSSNP